MGFDQPDGQDVFGGWPDRAIARLAERQRALVTRRQLLALGITTSALERAVRRGRLHRFHRGVYALVPLAALPPLAAEQAALLACGPTALLSHATAARLQGLLTSFSADVHLTVPGSHVRRGPSSVHVHQSTDLHQTDRHHRERLPVTSIPRTLIDLAPTVPARTLERAVDEALKRTSRTKLLAACDRYPARPGTPQIRALLTGQRPSSLTRRQGEENLRRLIRDSGLPQPEANVALGDYVPDLLWRRERVIVEFDSWEYHSGPGAFTADRTRHNWLTAQGYTVIHVTWRQLIDSPIQVLVWITQALARAT